MLDYIVILVRVTGHGEGIDGSSKLLKLRCSCFLVLVVEVVVCSWYTNIWWEFRQRRWRLRELSQLRVCYARSYDHVSEIALSTHSLPPTCFLLRQQAQHRLHVKSPGCNLRFILNKPCDRNRVQTLRMLFKLSKDIATSRLQMTIFPHEIIFGIA